MEFETKLTDEQGVPALTSPPEKLRKLRRNLRVIVLATGILNLVIAAVLLGWEGKAVTWAVVLALLAALGAAWSGWTVMRAGEQMHHLLLDTLRSQFATSAQLESLYEEARQRGEALELLRRASLQVTASLASERVLHAILEYALRLVKADDAHIFLYDGERLHFGAALWGGEIHHAPLSPPREHGLTYTVARSGERLVVSDVRHHPLFRDASWDGAIVGLPLRVGKQVIGVMNIAYHEPHAFTEHELRVLELLADQAAIALRNADLYEAANRQLKELTLLHAVATACAEATDEDQLIERVTELIGRTFYPDHFGVLLLDEEGDALYFHPSYRGIPEALRPLRIAVGQGIVGTVAQNRRSWLVNDVARVPVYIETTPGIQAELCVPLQTQERLLGVINAESRRRNAFTADDERLLTTLAGQLATAIERIRLFAESQTRNAELERALARARELEEVKNRFIQNVSHELRMPLAIIRGYAELLENGTLGELLPQQRQPVEIIHRRVRMLVSMVEDLTSILVAESQNLHREAVDMVVLARNLLADFRANAEREGLTLQEEIAVEEALVSGDSVYLRRVLDNLLGNALKFTPAGGRITLRLWTEPQEVVIEVADTGIGIPPDKLPHIFERFYQAGSGAKQRRGGYGLGLALVKEIVEAHGGQVTAESTLEEGSVFRITLPLLRPEATAA